MNRVQTRSAGESTTSATLDRGAHATTLGPWANRGQAGVSLLDILIGITILMIMVGGIAAASMTAGAVSTSSADTAKINVLLTAFGESLKNLPYHDCATPGLYQNDFDNFEGAFPADAQLIKDQLNATLIVDQVQLSSSCPTEDNGIQTIRLVAKVNHREHPRVIVKRRLVPKLAPFTVQIDEINQISPDHDPLVVWEVKASSPTEVFMYEWWCDGAWAEVPGADPPPGNTPVITYGETPTVECRYPAPTVANQYQTVAVRATELGTSRTAVAFKKEILSPRFGLRAGPVAGIEILNPVPPCTTADPCVRMGTPGQPGYGAHVTFGSTGVPPVDASINQWIWNFGDGSTQTICSVSDTDPTGANCLQQIHTYPEGGKYYVTLKVRDTFGAQSAAAMVEVVIEGDSILRPEITTTFSDPNSVTGVDPAWAISPQKISFTGSAKAFDINGDPLPVGKNWDGSNLQYRWDFGNAGAFANAGTASYTYPQTFVPTTYIATFTVVALVPGSTTQTVTAQKQVAVQLDPLEPPRNLRVTRQKGDLWLIRNAYFDFQWINVPRLPADVVRYEFSLGSDGGFCGFFGSNTRATRTTSVAGSPGTGTSYRFQFSSSPRGFNGICATDHYNVKARSVMDRPGLPAIGDCPVDKACSAWSPSLYLDPDFF